MKIVVENKIPYLTEAVLQISDDVTFLAAEEFTADSIKDADVLIIRTRVKCNEQLLKDTSVRFIATATIGYDHIDTAYCKKHNIVWKNAPGCNANSVCQYVESCLYLYSKIYSKNLNNLTLGIIGVGHVGSKVASLAKKMGMNVMLNDPLRSLTEKDFTSIDIKTICENADIITFHTPLVKDGDYPTYHLGNYNFFKSLQKRPLIINTSRGEVLITSAIKSALRDNLIEQAILDVWENEPNIDLNLLNEVFIGTPHIAGYSADGKALASQMAVQAVADFYNIPISIVITPPIEIGKSYVISARSYPEAVLAVYNPILDSNELKSVPSRFEWFRSHYPIRRELATFAIKLH